jgi:hypothetical protein
LFKEEAREDFEEFSNKIAQKDNEIAKLKLRFRDSEADW